MAAQINFADSSSRLILQVLTGKIRPQLQLCHQRATSCLQICFLLPYTRFSPPPWRCPGEVCSQSSATSGRIPGTWLHLQVNWIYTKPPWPRANVRQALCVHIYYTYIYMYKYISIRPIIATVLNIQQSKPHCEYTRGSSQSHPSQSVCIPL